MTANDNPRFLDMIAYLSIYAFNDAERYDIETLHTYLIKTLRVPHLNINKLDYLICASEKYSRYFNIGDRSYITLTTDGKFQLIFQKIQDATLSVSIYRIYNAVTERSYIGQARNPQARWQQHLRKLRDRTHHNKELQEDFVTYGEAEFSASILEENIPLYLSCNNEHYYCQEYDEVDAPIYNTAPIELKLNAFNGCEMNWF